MILFILAVLIVLFLAVVGVSYWLAMAAIKAIDDEPFVTPANCHRADRTD